MNKENCALKLVDEIILYYDARSKNIKLPCFLSVTRIFLVLKSLKTKLQGTQLYTTGINFLYFIKAPYLNLDGKLKEDRRRYCW